MTHVKKHTLEQLEASFVLAKDEPLRFINLSIASEGKRVIPHPLFLLMVRLILQCYRQKRGLLIQAPPEHGKTSLIIPLLLWILGHKSSMKIGIVCKSKDLVEEHLTRIRKAMLSDVFGSVFPAIQPDYKRLLGSGGEWSKRKLYLVGEMEPAFEAYTLFGAAEGHRLDMLWLDDCVTRECEYSEAARRNAASAIFETFANRLTDQGMAIFTNNCWHRADAIHQIKHSSIYSTLWLGYEDTDGMSYEIFNPPEGWKHPVKERLPLWPQWNKARLIKKMKSPDNSWKRLFRGIASTPENSRFVDSTKWHRYAEPDLINGRLYGYLDPAGGRSVKRGDYSALIVIVRYQDKTYDVVDCVISRVSADRQADSVFIAHEKWARLQEEQWERENPEHALVSPGFKKVGIEMLPKEEQWIKPLFQTKRAELQEAGNEYWQCPWKVNHPTEHKESRIEVLGSLLENGWLRFPEDLEVRAREDSPSGESWRHLIYQLEEWPFADHDDGPDGLAGAIEMTGGRRRKKRYLTAVAVR